MSDASEREAFIRAIIAEPDEDAPRLVFADWLDEHGEPERAEFIRLQCEREGRADPRERVSPTERERQLEREHGLRWEGEVTRPGVKAWGFRRGFIRTIAFADVEVFRQHVGRIIARGPAQNFLFQELSLERARALASTPELAHAVGLYLSSTASLNSTEANPGAAELFYSPFLINLRRLDLSGWRGGTVELLSAIGTHCPSLEELDVESTGQDDASLSAFVATAALPRLRVLNLSRNRVGNVGAIALARSTTLPALRRLDLTDNQVGGSGVAALLARTSLEQIQLEGNPIRVSAATEPAGGETIGPSATRRELVLLRTEMDDAGLTAMTRWPGWETVTDLILPDGPIFHAGLELLASSGCSPRLERLNANMGPWMLEALLLSPHLARLTQVSVDSLSDAPREEPSRERPELPATVMLTFHPSRGYYDGMVWLAGSACLTRLRGLRISRKGVRILASSQLTNLRELTVEALNEPELRTLELTTHLRALRRLELIKSRRGGGDPIALTLAGMPQLADLEELTLNNDGFSDVGALALATSPHLNNLYRLDLGHCHIGSDAIAALRKRFGDGVVQIERPSW